MWNWLGVMTHTDSRVTKEAGTRGSSCEASPTW